MFHKQILVWIAATLLAACSGELPVATLMSPMVEQPTQAGPVATESPAKPTDLPPSVTEPALTGTTPIMVEPPEQKAPQPINSEYLPQGKDGSLTQGNVFIDRTELLIVESYPIQVALVLAGSLPTPCNQLRVIARAPNEQNQIQIDVYSAIDTEQICAQVLEPFEAKVGLGSFPAGHYSVWINAELVGEFDA